MFKYTLALILGLATSSLGQEITCAANQVCTINGNSTLIVKAPKSVPALVINCITSTACKKNGVDAGLKVYSSANKTYIMCEGEDACEEISLNFGITPYSGLASDWEVTRDEVRINCIAKQSCKGIIINTDGTITNGLNIETSDEEGSLSQALIECGSSQCNLDCGEISLEICKDTKCYGSCNCSPIGENSGCPNDLGVRPTPEPTQSPSDIVVIPPTPKPTPSPTDSRNVTSCATGVCNIDGFDNLDIFCESTATECNIDCSLANQCSEDVIIEANSGVVNIICGASGSCDNMRIIGVNANTINIVLSGDNSAEHMTVIIDNEGATVNILASGDESFIQGKLFCDGQSCNLNCMGTDSCKQTLYECLATEDKCNCINNCETGIQYFGDADCVGSETLCEIIGDGSKRIVALNTVDTLVVDCSNNEGQCKKIGAGLRIFSAAKHTIIKCNNKDACEEITVRVGALSDAQLPKGFKSAEFEASIMANTTNVVTQTLNMDCSDEYGCKELFLYTASPVATVITADGEGALEDATLICDDCVSLNYQCRNFDGCINTNVLCPAVAPMQDNRCVCDELFVFVNTTIETTESPRNTCPDIGVYSPRKKAIVAVNNNAHHVITQGSRVLIAIVLIAAIAVLVTGFVLLKCKKGYKEINDSVQVNQKMLKNENIYSTYQVEMH